MLSSKSMSGWTKQRTNTSRFLRFSRKAFYPVQLSASKLAHEPLDLAIQSINRMITAHEAKVKARASVSGKRPIDIELRKSKRIQIRAGLNSNRIVQEPVNHGKPSTLRDYLSLPVEKYSLLDPKWIQRGNTPEQFLLKVPLQEVAGFELEPSVSIRVAVDTEKSQVHFTAEDFLLGDPKFDQDFDVRVLATLRSHPVESSWLTKTQNWWTSSAPLAVGTGGGAAAQDSSVPGPSGADVGTATNSCLEYDVDIQLSLAVPYPLTVVPGMLLSSTGGLILRLALQSLAPSFLDLLNLDYQRWASSSGERTDSVGNLVSGTSEASAVLSAR